jgi:tetratricopeptide (TPR) repeat protein
MGKTRFIPALMLAASIGLGAAAGQIAQVTQTSMPATTIEAQNGLQLIDAAHALEMSGQRDEALAAYTNAIESHELDRDSQARALFSRGLLLDGMNRLREALQDYTAALSLSPKFAAAWNNRANIYRRQGSFSEAEHDYRASLAAGNRQSQYPYYGLGQIAEARGQSSEARTFYAKAIAADPTFDLARQRMAALDEPQPIHLHPPKLARSEDDQTVIPTSLPAQTVHLRPPSRKLAGSEDDQVTSQRPLAPTQPVHIHPPKLPQSQEDQVASPAVPSSAQPVHLRPSSPKLARSEEVGPQLPAVPPLSQPAHLHPPKLPLSQDDQGRPSRPVSSSTRPVHLRSTMTASYQRDIPSLRPSLDQGGQAQIQLGAWRTEAEAAQGWNRALRQAGGVLEGLAPEIVRVDLPGKGRYYRLRVATDKSGTKTLCAALVAKGLECFLARD